MLKELYTFKQAGKAYLIYNAIKWPALGALAALAVGTHATQDSSGLPLRSSLQRPGLFAMVMETGPRLQAAAREAPYEPPAQAYHVERWALRPKRTLLPDPEDRGEPDGQRAPPRGKDCGRQAHGHQ